MRRKPHAAALAASLCALALPAVAFSGNGGFAPPEPGSPDAESIRDIYWLLSAVAIFIFLVVSVPLVVFVVRFRSRGRDRSLEGPQVRGNTNLELGWTAGATLVVLVIVAFVFVKLSDLRTATSAAAGDADLSVRVEGRQFYWQFEYENGVVAIDRLRLPVDRLIDLELTAPDGDVIHSFWVPELAGKLDTTPGVVRHLVLRPTETGSFEGKCAELCGLQHAVMLLTVEVLPEAEFERWLEQEGAAQQAGRSTLGEEIFAGVCGKCHAADGGLEAAPQLAGNPLLGDRAGLEDIVRNGRGAMPAVGQEWSEEQFEALFEFTQELAGGAGSGG